jgi:hypothetical protein
MRKVLVAANVILTFAVCFVLANKRTALAQDRKPIPVPDAPKEMAFKSLRGVQYCGIVIRPQCREGRGHQLLQYQCLE